MVMRFLLFAVIILFSPISVAFAQVGSDSFNININVLATESVPPTTPTLLSADPISASQIDLTWSAATDNFVVIGYTVTRGGFVIATTSLLSFADTGLAASTTYTYSVRAFDSSLNYSSSSNSLATTTPEVFVGVVNQNEPPSATAARVVLDEIVIEPGYSTSTFYLRTPRPARLEIRWGRSASYELGYVVGSVFKKDHTFPLTDLEPGTIYEYQIIGYTVRGVSNVLRTGTFTTLSDASLTAPVNVSRFVANQFVSDVVLDWQNPKMTDFAYVRIVRSHLGFPEYPTDGAVVYQGVGSRVVDAGVLDIYSPVYYTAFVYDTFGNTSSGAVTMLYASQNDTAIPGPDSLIGGINPPIITSEATSTVNLDRVTPEMRMPESSDILVTQGDMSFSLLDTPLYLDSSQPFVVSVPRDTVVGNLKSIIATILNPTDTRVAYSFLLRINKDQSAYVTSIAPLEVLGKSQLQIEIYDYEAFVVATYQTPVEFVLPQTKDRIISRLLDSFSSIVYVVGGVGLIGVLAYWFMFWLRRRTEDNV
jgi:hypothetical protein